MLFAPEFLITYKIIKKVCVVLHKDQSLCHEMRHMNSWSWNHILIHNMNSYMIYDLNSWSWNHMLIHNMNSDMISWSWKISWNQMSEIIFINSSMDWYPLNSWLCECSAENHKSCAIRTPSKRKKRLHIICAITKWTHVASSTSGSEVRYGVSTVRSLPATCVSADIWIVQYSLNRKKSPLQPKLITWFPS